jgi:hypothetical protein
MKTSIGVLKSEKQQEEKLLESEGRKEFRPTDKGRCKRRKRRSYCFPSLDEDEKITKLEGVSDQAGNSEKD